MSQTVFEPDWRHCYSISALKENEWNQLAGPNPFVQHAFLKALESSGCVGPADTGWEPAHLIGFHGKQLVAAMPLYRKWHSYGEYVFDHAWAQAYASTGFNYFPKLVCAIPYSPVSGPRLLAQTEDLLKALPRQLMQAARNLDVSSVHALFIAKDERDTWTQAGFHERAQIQFGWNNPGYESFSEFLDTLRHDKRKKIKQERKRTAGQDLHFECLEGQNIRPETWAFFHSCYVKTYRMHLSLPYLNLEFFETLGSTMPDTIRLILAKQSGRPIAAALFFTDGTTLYGRHWGALLDLPGLHFETCYYQAIEYAIQTRLKRVEAGVQGEHKLARGYVPQQVFSMHHMVNPDWNRAIHDWLKEEKRFVLARGQSLNERIPFHLSPGLHPGQE